MTIVVSKPPLRPSLVGQDTYSIFIGGSIEQGIAEDWQKLITDQLEADGSLIDKKVVVFNPRRDAWDASWPQDPTPGTLFEEQVTWELDHLEISDLNIFYFSPGTKSPVTLLELGLAAQRRPSVVCCPREYWRYGNVKIVSDRFKVQFTETLDELYNETVKRIHVGK